MHPPACIAASELLGTQVGCKLVQARILRKAWGSAELSSTRLLGCCALRVSKCAAAREYGRKLVVTEVQHTE